MINTKSKDNVTALVSVIIPTYNRPEMLKEAVMSVLSQTYQNFEIIVVNDAGEDVKDVVNSLNSEGNIVYLQHTENKGLPAARNTGIKVAKGKYIAYLDDDDIYYPNHIETLVEFLEKTGFKIAYTDSYHTTQSWLNNEYITTSKNVKYSYDFDRKKLLISNYFPVINVMHRKDILEETGLFDESLHAHEDWDLWIRLSQHHDFYHIKEVTAEVRTRDDSSNMTTSNPMAFLHTMKTIHKRYAHLVTDRYIIEDIIEEQKKAKNALELYSKIATMENYIKSLKETINEKDQQFINLQSHVDIIIQEKDKYIESLKGEIDSKDKYAKDLERNLESFIKEKDKYIESLKEAIDKKDKYIKDFEVTLEAKGKELSQLQSYLESTIIEKDQYIESLKELVDKKDKYLKDIEGMLEAKGKELLQLQGSLETMMVEKDKDIERLNSELNAMKNMIIYRLLKKFKFIKCLLT
jgi:glycosyltransferase involved in cell wall biosynthesis